MGLYMSCRKLFEINIKNSIIKELNNRIEIDHKDSTVGDLSLLLFDTCLISSGFNIDEPSLFASRIHRMIKLGLGIDDEHSNDEKETSAAAAACTRKIEELD